MGARFWLNLKKGWFAMLKGDADGFGGGSNVTWQIYSSAGNSSSNIPQFVGYRHLSVDHIDGGFAFDAAMSGTLRRIYYKVLVIQRHWAGHRLLEVLRDKLCVPTINRKHLVLLKTQASELPA
jgi:hypothetical protein